MQQITFLLIFSLMFGVLYFMNKKQKKQYTEHFERLKQLKKGDAVITIGGLHGIVDEIHKERKEVVLDIDGIYLTFELSAIKTVSTEQMREVIEEKESAVEK